MTFAEGDSKCVQNAKKTKDKNYQKCDRFNKENKKANCQEHWTQWLETSIEVCGIKSCSDKQLAWHDFKVRRCETKTNPNTKAKCIADSEKVRDKNVTRCECRD